MTNEDISEILMQIALARVDAACWAWRNVSETGRERVCKRLKNEVYVAATASAHYARLSEGWYE